MSEHRARPDAADWSELKRIFHLVVAAPQEERSRLLDRHTAHSPALRAELESLLEADGGAARVDAIGDGILGAIDPMIGRTVGVFRVEREIGHGGMGTVYLARRSGEFDQTVAIKIVRRGMDTALVLLRFMSERKILATLEHPHIARLIDGGSTDDGRPYFVMEYLLDAVPITTYCDSRALAIEARVRLFLVACGAVQYAHQRLVVHRDLKPGNVVVTADGAPKLLDFGLAKLLERQEDGEEATQYHERLLTPKYASPEQLRGIDTGIPSDVYSLGVILHKLLTGELPDGVTAPSAQAGAAGRQLRGDLDTILMTALQPDPDRRYQTVHELSEDLRRYLESRPILARPESLGYRARKFAVRNRVAVGAAAIVLLSMSSGLVLAARSARVAAVERARAERHLDDVRQLTHQLLFDLHDEIGKLPGNIAVRQRLLAQAVAYLDQLSADLTVDRAMQLETATAYDRVGALAFDMKGALANYRKAAAMFDRLTSDDPLDPAAAHAQVVNLHNTGDLHKMMGDVGAALADGERALAIANRWDADAARLDARQRAGIDMLVYRSHALLGLIYEDAGEFERGAAAYQRALDIAVEGMAFHAGDPSWRRCVIGAESHLAINRMGRGDVAGALPLLESAAARLRPLVQLEPINVNYQRDWWMIRLAQGRARRLSDDLPAAQVLIEEALSIKQGLADSDPGDTGHQRGLAMTHFRFFEVLFDRGRLAEAARHLTLAIGLSNRLVTGDPSNLESQIDLGEFEQALSRLLRAQGRPGEAGTEWEHARRRLEHSAALSPRNRRVAAMLAAPR